MTRQNLCPNPACTNNTTGWSSNSTFTRSTTITGIPPSGQAVTTGITFTGNGFVQVPTAVAAPGDVFTVSFYIKNNTGSSIGAKTCYAAFTRSAGGDDFSQTFTVTPGASGSVVRGSFTAAGAPALATGIYVLIDQLNGTAGSGIDITAVLLEKVGALDTYFDGSFPGASWDGTAGNSTSTLADAGSTPNGLAIPVVLGSPAADIPGASPDGIAVSVRLGLPTAGELPVAGSESGGGWYGLLSTLKERDATRRLRESLPPAACPHDGEALIADGRGGLKCRFDGWRWPNDGGAIR